MYIDRREASTNAERLGVYIKNENTIKKIVEIVKTVEAPVSLRIL